VKGLSVGQHCDLVVEGGSRMTARIEDLSDEQLVLGLFREPDQRLPGLAGTVEFIDQRGIYRLGGTLEAHGRERDAVRLIPVGEPELIQRREYVRVDCYAPVDVTFEEREGVNAVGTTTVNVSASGMLLAGPSVLAMGELISLALDIGEEEPVRVKGRVVRETQEGFKGVHIVEMNEATQDRLIRFVLLRQRQARSMSKGG
jgi:c-di-GMP-binding flagellar brake protein YcgR